MQNNHTTTLESSENSNPREKSRWEYNPFHCSWERHFASMKSRFAPLLYSWGRGLSYKSDSFHPSVENMANYLRRHRTTVMRALEELIEQGWAEVIHSEPGKPVAYRFIDHEEWAHQHPDKCVTKDEMPWKDEVGDALAPRLHSVSYGLAKFYAGQMKGLRKSGLPDDQIVREFRVFLDRNPQTGKAWKTVYYRFRKHLLQVADDLRDAANAADSGSGVSHRSDTYQSRGSDTPCRTEATPTSRTGATQVFEVRPEVGPMVGAIPALHSQGPLTSQPINLLKGGLRPPVTP